MAVPRLHDQRPGVCGVTTKLFAMLAPGDRIVWGGADGNVATVVATDHKMALLEWTAGGERRTGRLTWPARKAVPMADEQPQP